MNNIAPITTLSQVTLNFFVRGEQPVDPESIDQETVNKTIKGLRVIEERGTGLKKFVENYRKFTKLPDPDLKEVDITRLVADALLVCSGFDNFHKVRVEESLPGSNKTVTDDGLLSQVLINILKNAIEILTESETTKDPLIRLKLSQDTSRIRIDICNNGEPIPPELREQIFVPFFTTKENGSGIGLSLSKQIMLKLGGDIILHTDSRSFTCFTVTLPRQDSKGLTVKSI
jgi:signal transduction histidine kinase